ncbi:aromatic ring-hydroxylating dioxygenase subunit alpha [Nitrospirillum sp. BR 11163]|uniref:aromatic ring-hydroxylating oxygenase subunit alpha n=1 Tax=Nitrospirillum sp. BR 11163 TaxID=3104323 RepID=UPI002AFEDF00|nr:aromatic ring-hydroxylating dioxygenase subunit alpha [Nitrospirillum sp. BR 11163]MEA1671947.1 aromatic ring-hydroxylating dioxygenase subunit alpha [Nitrospirillum sp. BR 11163]
MSHDIVDSVKRSRILLGNELPGARSLSPDLYTNPAVFDLELERVFRNQWLCIGRQSQLAQVGDHFCVELLGQRLIAIRARHDAIRVLSPVCSHRGSLITCETGTVTRLQCPYHKWVYDLEGRLIATPLMAIQGELARDLDLQSFACEIWHGWIMVNLDGRAPPLAETTAEISGQINPWNIGAMVPLCDPIVFEGNYNWKIVCDNQGESYHLIGPHAQSVAPYVRPQDSAFYSDLKTYVKSEFPSASGAIQPVFGERPAWVPAGFNGSWSYNLFPNHIFVVTDDFVVWQHQLIHGYDRCTNVMWVLGHPAVKELPNFAAQVLGVRNGVLRVEGEDQESFETVWAGLRAGGARPGPFASSERGSWLWQRWLVDALAGHTVEKI